jgi:hypothetical protein
VNIRESAPGRASPWAGLPLGVMVAVGIGVIGASRLDQGDYRAAALPGLVLSERLLPRDGSPTPAAEPGGAWSGATLPVEGLVATVGEALAGDPAAPFRSHAIGATLFMALAGLFTVVAAARIAGPGAALGATLAFVGLPGTFAHASTLGPEAGTTLTVACLLFASTLRPGGRPQVLVATAALASVAAAHTAGLVFAVPWLIGIGAATLARRDGDGAVAVQVGEIPIGPLPWRALIPAIAGPALFIAAWPHLHTDFGKRLLALLYAPWQAPLPPASIAGVAYDGTAGGGPPFVVALWDLVVRHPLIIVLAAAAGAGVVLAAVRHRSPARSGAVTLAVLGFGLLLCGLNGSPSWDGRDGLALLAPSLAILAGLGAAAFTQFVGVLVPSLGGTRAERLLPALLLISAPLDLAKSRPVEFAYRSALIGGTAGAMARGYDVLPPGHLPSKAIEWMNENLPPRARVAFGPENALPGRDTGERTLFEALRQRGVVRRDLEGAALFHATHLVLLGRSAAPHFSEWLNALGEPLVTFDHSGARLLAIYAL